MDEAQIAGQSIWLKIFISPWPILLFFTSGKNF